MESGLLRTLTDKSAREGAQGDADIVADAPAATQAAQDNAAPPPEGETSQREALQSTPQSVAPPRHRSRVLFVIAGAVAAIVLTFDAWLITHHRQPTKPSAAPPSAPSNARPTYTLLPLGTPPPPDPPDGKMPAAVPTNLAVVEAAAPAIVAPRPHRHGHGHHRH